MPHTVPRTHCLATMIICLLAGVFLWSWLSSTRLPVMQWCLTCLVPSSACWDVFPNMSVMGTFRAEYQQLRSPSLPAFLLTIWMFLFLLFNNLVWQNDLHIDQRFGDNRVSSLRSPAILTDNIYIEKSVRFCCYTPNLKHTYSRSPLSLHTFVLLSSFPHSNAS